jgi:hypothetical protein
MGILRSFRLVSPAPDENLRELLIEEGGIPWHLMSELYTTHDKCRRQLARVELKIYYSRIPAVRSRMKELLPERFYSSAELMGWGNFVRYIDKLENLLKVRSPRAAKLRKELDEWRKKKARQ